ncbi:MAG TPA: hypothetical protein VEA69_01225 [Tepidisphaeraceae bacterium]|nr:hypothetical protein [Tepidisphaeraceae bacterium]
MTPTSVIPVKPPRQRKRRVVAPPTPPPPVAPPVLVSASFDPGTLTLSLAFDRAVDASALVPGALVVADGPGGLAYAGAGAATVVSAVAIAVPMAAGGAAGGASVLLTASAASGIVSLGGSVGNGEWAGVTDLSLPFPTPPPPDPPVLIAARFDSMLLRLTLWFDRNVDSSEADVAAFVVHDGRDTHASYVGSGPVGLISGSAIEILLASTGAYEGFGATLAVSDANGVVSQADDVPWGGVAGDALPLPGYPPANVVSATYAGNAVTLAFDVPVWLNGTGGGGPTPDDAVKFDGNVPFSVVQINDNSLLFMVGGALGPGSTWVIERQPAWVGADVAAPQDGVFE